MTSRRIVLILAACATVLLASSLPAADAWACPEGNARMTSHVYFVNDASTPVLTLDGVQAGDKVRVDFTLAEGCHDLEISFVSYDTDSSHTLDTQTVFSQDTGNFTGSGNLTITVPSCFWQIDLVFGPVIQHFDSQNGTTYHGQNRFIDGKQGGSECPPPVTTPQIPFFPSTTSAVLAALGAIGAAAMVVVMRRRA